LTQPREFPVSIKGVVAQDGRVLLLKNDRAEWELPGGRIELGETPEQCVAREIAEETGWPVDIGPILDSWMYPVEGRHVFVVTYGCVPVGVTPPVLSDEHQDVGLFTPAEVPGLNIPAGYKRSIATWFDRMRTAPGFG
jgi:8-oxo-dGTP pyrophosphatase MutT (NUDIX family)